jgi:hypothetical protein
MENHGILDPNTVSQIRKRYRLRAVVFWLFIVLSCALYGFFVPGNSASTQLYGESFDIHLALESMFAFVALGIGDATCIAMGYLILGNVRAGRQTKLSGIITLLIASMAAAPLTVLVMLAGRSVSQLHFFQQEEAALGMGIIAWWTLRIAALVFVLYTVLILLFQRNLASTEAKFKSPKKTGF